MREAYKMANVRHELSLWYATVGSEDGLALIGDERIFLDEEVRHPLIRNGTALRIC